MPFRSSCQSYAFVMHWHNVWITHILIFSAWSRSLLLKLQVFMEFLSASELNMERRGDQSSDYGMSYVETDGIISLYIGL